MADLRLSVEYGSDLLEREVGGVFTTDLIDPSRYLGGGELVLSGLVWHSSPADSREFVRVLAASDVAALAAGTAAKGAVPADLAEACSAYGVPLLGVPEEISFGTITQRVLDRTGSGAARREVLRAMTGGGGLAEAVLVVGREVGGRCAVASPAGRVVAGTLDESEVDLLVAGQLSAARLPTLVEAPSGKVWSVFPAGEVRTESWFLVCSGDHRQWAGDVVEAVTELCGLIALERAHAGHPDRWEGRIADQVLAALSAGVLDDTGMAAFGFSPRAELAVAVATPVGAATGLLADAASVLGMRAAVGTLDAAAVAIVEVGSAYQAFVDTVRVYAGRLGAGGRIVAGLSGQTTVPAASGAYDEARQALRLAGARQEPAAVVTSDELTSHVALLAAVPDGVRRVFADRLLGPVLDYDRRNHADLLPTLAGWLAHGGSWNRCAAAMHLHLNTVRYRIGRVEAIIGRDLSRTENRVDAYLALRCLGIEVAADGGQVPR